MFSSNNSNSENSQNYPTQWALNPSAYQNVSNESVDWAALAQQWIMMKESVPPEHPPKHTPKEMLNEGGEAPMDVENEKEESDEQWTENSNSTPSAGAVHDQWNWQQWGTTWPANWNGPPPQAGVVPQPATVVPLNKTALLPTPFTHYGPPGSDANNTSSGDFPGYDSTSAPITGVEFPNTNSTSSGGYWTSSGAGRGKYPLKGGRMPRKGFQTQDIRPEVTSAETVTLDAARRRQLPAWIREGLEKMEREKQKQLDKERERIEREEYLSRKKELKNDALELLRSADGSVHPPKSKFDSDSGDSADEGRTETSNKTRNPPPKNRRGAPSPRSSSPPLPLSEEERMAWVRRAMTEVLLQVTSSEIESICQEELNRYRSRTSAKKGGRLAAPGAGPPAAGTLGLGIYGGGSSESDSDTENESRDGEDKKSGSNNANNEETSKRHQTHRENLKRRPSDSVGRRGRQDVDGNSDSSVAEKGSGDSQVDTTRSHGQSSRSDRRNHNDRRDRNRDRRHRSRSTSDSSSETSSSETKTKKRQPKKIKKKNRHSSSSELDDSSCSDSKSSDSRNSRSRSVTATRDDKNTSRRDEEYSKDGRKTDKRYRSKSVESEKRHERRNNSVESDKKRSSNRKHKATSRSASTESDTRSTKESKEIIIRKRTESVASSRTTHHSDRGDRSERSRQRERSRSRRRSRSKTDHRNHNHDYRDHRSKDRERVLRRNRSSSRSRRQRSNSRPPKYSRSRSNSRSRRAARNRRTRSRSRSRDRYERRYDRDRDRRRSRTRSRDRRQSYRSRRSRSERRSRSRTRSRSGGGKRRGH